MKCPVCPDTTLTMTNRENIEIDYCPKCRGVWLDRGELDKIIERSAAQQSEPQPTDPRQPIVDPRQPPIDPRYPPPGYRPYDDDYYKKHHYHKRKRGLLGDLFDFD